MAVFNTLYAKYYNLLYRDKDYAGEAAYVAEHIRRHAPKAQTILEFGCGTGRHAIHLAEKGYTVTGIDRSIDMLEEAELRRATCDDDITDRLTFMSGDFLSFQPTMKYDVVTALFHVMSYQTSDEDLERAFSVAAASLKRGGLFVFDCWYGPAVLEIRPELRVKRTGDGAFSMTRIAEPTMKLGENRVDVAYQIFLRDHESESLHEFSELHQMRYLFLPEIEQYMGNSGLTLLTAEEWMSGRPPGPDTWGCCFLARLD